MKESLDFIWRIGYPLFLYLWISAAVEFVAGTGGDSGNGSHILIVMSVSAVLTAVILGILYKKTLIRLPVRVTPGLFTYVWVLSAAAGSCVFMNTIIAGLSFFTKSDIQTGIWIYDCPLYLQLAAIGILVPLAEELVFRGMGYIQMRTRFTFIQAAVFSSVYFAVYHGNPAQAVYAFVLGFITAWICEQYGMLRLSVWFHISANISSIVITNLSARESTPDVPLWLKLIVSAVLTLAGIYKIREDVNKREIVNHCNSLL